MRTLGSCRGGALRFVLCAVHYRCSDLSTTLCRGITGQVLAPVPLRARLNGHPVVAGLPLPTGDVIPVAGGAPS